ncbi:alpha-ribazole phosphatase [Enteractinococcus fodinae]|uniref:Broad specificity phosphatase PhoE n=1 Tax=Enteractinococcus fodinae TaxID=684663 RepID=A0ABU2B443_9MICC|nr:histidine phosphatase family protein [Enteractinococcus fodinae]MDR7348372.1 broad specificity phosphatase PhoE [Enteractinococcus fodinae]
MSSFLGKALGGALLTRAMQVTNVYLVRHGQQVRGGHDSPESLGYDAHLSDTGRRQAQAVGRALEGAELDVVYSSDLVRAHDTGKAIAASHGHEVCVDPRLKEIGVFRDVPEDQSYEQAVGAEKAQEATTRMMETLKWDSIALGEGSAEFRRRVHGAIWEIVRRHQNQNIAIACHGGVINAFISEEYGLERDFLFRPAHAGITRMRFTEDRAVMLTGNEITHLENEDILTF